MVRGELEKDNHINAIRGIARVQMPYPVSVEEVERCIVLLEQKYSIPLREKGREMRMLFWQMQSYRRYNRFGPDYGTKEPVRGDPARPRNEYYFRMADRWDQLREEGLPLMDLAKHIDVVRGLFNRRDVMFGGSVANVWCSLVRRFIRMNGCYTHAVAGGCIGYYGFEPRRDSYYVGERPQELRPEHGPGNYRASVYRPEVLDRFCVPNEDFDSPLTPPLTPTE